MISHVLKAWGKILSGSRPVLSIEITRECPLRCPGCYAYGDDHLGGAVTLRQLSDYQGDTLVERFFQLIDKHKPLHVSIIGGEPLVRFRELNRILPVLSERGIHAQVVTSAVRPIPVEWRGLENLEISVSIDGLQPEHDARRAPATYDRILRHIEGHHVTVHCTVTQQQARRPGYLEEFVTYWSARDTVSKILMSLYTPQVGEISDERLTAAGRKTAIDDLLVLRAQFPKLKMSEAMIKMFATPPASPAECVFARLTTCVSANLETQITPCQFGGVPACTDCGCAASAGLSAIGAYRLAGVVPLGAIFARSLAVGDAVERRRRGSE